MRFRSLLPCVPAALMLASSAFAACTATPYNGLTAAVVNPSGPVTGEVDATGCNIGVYFDQGSGSVAGADVHGASHFGVLVNAATAPVHVDVLNSTIHEIGHVPFDGVQQGVAIHYRGYFGFAATGTISGNGVSQYQKAGIVTNGLATDVQIDRNTVTGLGPVSFIAQNGIQVGYGAHAKVRNNVVSGHSFTGTSTVSGGIVVVGGPCYGTCPDGNPCAYTNDTVVQGNTVTNNDVGVFLTNINGVDCGWPETPTSVRAQSNVVSSSAVTSGYGYQAGISDVGNGDRITANRVSGVGYTPVPGDVPYLRFIDADPSFTKDAKVNGNH